MTTKKNRNIAPFVKATTPLSKEDLVKAISLIEEASPFENPDHLVQFLIDDCHLADSEAIQVASLQKGSQNLVLPAITDVELFLTEECNLRCPYCFVEGKSVLNVMSEETAERSLDFIFSDKNGSPPRVGITFFGGEPFANFPLLKSITKSAKLRAKAAQIPLSLSATTNGTLLDHEKLKFCRDERVHFLLSIDGVEDAHDSNRFFANKTGSWKMIIDKLPLMRGYQPWLGAKMTVSPAWAHKALDGVLELANQGINQILVGPASGVHWSKEKLSLMKTQMLFIADWYFQLPDDVRGHQIRIDYKDFQCGGKENLWGCRAGRSTISITTDGRIFPCSKMAGANASQGVLPLGNIFSDPLDQTFRKVLCGLLPAARPVCRRCSLRSDCMGGCYATNSQATGDAFLPAPLDCFGSEIADEISTRHRKIIQADAMRFSV